MSPDCKLIAVVGGHLDSLLLDSQNGKTVSSLVGHLDYSFSSAWHPDGRIFSTGNQDKTCRLWDIINLSSPVAVRKGNLGAITSIRFSSDGQFMAVAEPADLFTPIVPRGITIDKRDFFGEISEISLSPDDESLFIGVPMTSLMPVYFSIKCIHTHLRQRDIAIACMSIHNFLRHNALDDWLFKQYENDAFEMNEGHVNDEAEREENAPHLSGREEQVYMNTLRDDIANLL